MSYPRNPFRPGNGIDPPYMAGREKILSSLEKVLDEAGSGLPRNVIFFGLRGTGKTVLMRRFKILCELKNWVCVEREFNERFRNEEAFSEAVSKDIISPATELSIRKRAKEFGKKVIEYVKPEEISALGIKYRPFYKRSKTLLEDHLKDLLVENLNVFETAGEEVRGLVLLYDEFHTVKDDERTDNFPLASFLGALAHAQRKSSRYILVVSGLPNIKQNLKEAKTYTERMFKFIDVTNLGSEASRKAIEEPLKKSEVEFSQDLIDEIIKQTKGYPYFLQFYCYFIIDRIPKNDIGLDDFKEIYGELLRELDISFFEDRFQRASDQEQDVLLAMAQIGEENISTKQIAKKMKTVGYQTLLVLLSRLIDKNLIYRPKKGKYCFALPLFRDYLLRKI